MNSQDLLEKVAPLLAQLPWRIIYLGGSTTHLHISDALAPLPEFTDDVDVVAEVTSPVEFQVNLREKLRAVGAKEDTSEDAPLCRWKLNGITVDVMSPNRSILGFANRWYPLAIRTAAKHMLRSGQEIETIVPIVFIATKLEAFHDRGKSDCLASKDVDDIIAVIDGRLELASEARDADEELRSYLHESLSRLNSHPDFAYAVEGYLKDTPDRVEMFHQRMKALLENLTD